MYANNNNLLYDFNDDTFISHSKIKHGNNKIILHDEITINENNVSFFSNKNSNDIFNINISNKHYFSINETSTNINSTIIVNNINLNTKVKNILYDLYGPIDPIFSYDFRNNYNFTLYALNRNTNIREIYFNQHIYNLIETKNINQINIDYISKNIVYDNCGFNIKLEPLYFTNITLLNTNLKTFKNNILDFNVNNKYNFNISIYYKTDTIIYPYDSINNIYGLKAEIK